MEFGQGNQTANGSFPRIEVRSVRKSFGDQVVLDGCDLKLEDGEIVVLLGRNGCGKSVLFKIIDSLLHPDSGNVLVDGESITEANGSRLDEIRRKIGYVFQKSGLFDSMSVGENVSFMLRRFKMMPEDQIQSRVEEKLTQVGLPDAASKMPAELSGGMQKRAGLARAIIQDPEIILYDDPTAGLDPVLTDAIAALILDLRERLEVSSLVITHDLNLVEKIGDRIYLMYQGKIRGGLSWPELKQSSDPVIQQYLKGDLEGPISLIE
jgi:phospholipid/cholesterol/gamma-HCH transport system ATP-binding protein